VGGAWLSYESRCDSLIAFACEERFSGATVRRKVDGCMYRRIAARQIDRARLGWDGTGIRGIGI
jgi:hypothetical protein